MKCMRGYRSSMTYKQCFSSGLEGSDKMIPFHLTFLLPTYAAYVGNTLTFRQTSLDQVLEFYSNKNAPSISYLKRVEDCDDTKAQKKNA